MTRKTYDRVFDFGVLIFVLLGVVAILVAIFTSHLVRSNVTLGIIASGIALPVAFLITMMAIEDRGIK